MFAVTILVNIYDLRQVFIRHAAGATVGWKSSICIQAAERITHSKTVTLAIIVENFDLK